MTYDLSKTAGILLAAGNSQRMGTNKMLLTLCGKTALEWSVKAMIDAGIKTLTVTVSQATLPTVNALAQTYAGVHIAPVFGGETRAMSVLNALRSVPLCRTVVIHDGARCLITPDAIRESVRLADEHGSAIAMTPARDTIRSTVTHKSIKREEHVLIQTPQTFAYDAILKAYEAAFSEGGTIQDQDDCAVYRRSGHEPCYFDAGILNQKLTYPSDIPFFAAILNERNKQ